MPRSSAVIAAAVVAVLAACSSRAPATHWPKSAGAITPDDPADDGGESLEPRQVSEGAAAIEHGGNELTSILDEPPTPAAAPAPTPTPAAGAAAPSTPADAPPEAVPVFEEIIIVN